MGDIFLIPLDDISAAGGQVISIREKEELYLAIFGKRLGLDETDLEKIVSGQPVLLTLSLDAKIWHGSWPIIGNLIRLVRHYPQPNYKVEHAGVMSLESRDTKVRRAVTPEELGILKYRSVVAPQNIENAIRAYFGIGAWTEYHNGLSAQHAIASSKLLQIKPNWFGRQYANLFTGLHRIFGKK